MQTSGNAGTKGNVSRVARVSHDNCLAADRSHDMFWLRRSMYEAVIAACKTLDEFGLPRAIGRFDADRLIFANRSFLDAIGLEKDEAAGLALSAMVKIHLDSREAAKVGRLVPITVRSPLKQIMISGHATFGEDGLVFLMLVLPSEPSAELEAAMAVKREQERQRIASYIHEYIAPELMSVVFSIESIRLQLEDLHLPAAAKFKELGDRLTKLIDPAFRAS